MTATELTVELKGLDERANNLRLQFDRQDKTVEELRRSIEQLNTVVAKLQQRLDDHVVHVEKSDARRFTTIGFFIVGLIALVNGLLLTWVRK